MFSFCLSSILSPGCLCLLHKAQLFVFLFPLNSLAGLEDYREIIFLFASKFLLTFKFFSQCRIIISCPAIHLGPKVSHHFCTNTMSKSIYTGDTSVLCSFLLVFPSVPEVQTKWLCLFIFLYPFPDEMSLEETRIFLSLVLFLLWSHG